MYGLLPTSRFRVLYLPDEGVPGDQAGPRRFWEGAVREGRIAELESFSFLHAWRSLGSQGVEQLKEKVSTFRPTHLFWQHVSTFPADPELLSDLRGRSPGLKIVYYELDMYGRLRKPPTSAMKALFRCADLIFLSGEGGWKRQVEAYGAKRVLYVPTPFDEGRFGGPWSREGDPDFDVVMIGSLIRPRLGLPLGGIPGGRDRLRLALALYRFLGPRFAVYGRGWEHYPFSRGPLPYDLQQTVMRNSWITTIWDHFPGVDYYFSDRFPISLASGVAHACNWRNGLEAEAASGAFIHAKDVESLTQAILRALSGPRQFLMEMGERGSELAFRDFTTQRVYQGMLETMGGL